MSWCIVRIRQSVEAFLQLADQAFNLSILQSVQLLHLPHLRLQHLDSAAQLSDGVLTFC